MPCHVNRQHIGDFVLGASGLGFEVYIGFLGLIRFMGFRKFIAGLQSLEGFRFLFGLGGPTKPFEKTTSTPCCTLFHSLGLHCDPGIHQFWAEGVGLRLTGPGPTADSSEWKNTILYKRVFGMIRGKQSELQDPSPLSQRPPPRQLAP